MQSSAGNVDEYLASLAEDRRAAIAAVRQTILDNLDGGYGPHVIFPAGYRGNPRGPLPLAQQWAKSGKRLDLGKSCIRFKKLAELDLATIGEAVRRMPAERYIALYNAARQGRK